MHFIGVDPGFTGALALLDPDGSLIDVRDMPLIITAGKTKLSFDADGMPVEKVGTAHELDFDGIVSLLAEWQETANKEITYCQEKVWVQPRDGAVSAGKLMFGAGILQGIAAGLQIPIRQTIAPSSWKAKMGVTSDKNTSLELARTMFPSKANLFRRRKDDGRAEAALIGLYAYRNHTQSEQT
jgi:crossover junction endodeoxyribonuclease RuvC